MTTKRSMFGSLEQRIKRGSPVGQNTTRHVWLDGDIPALVTDRRQRGGVWEGLVLYEHNGQPVHEWATGDRITPVTQHRQ